jgi:2-oxoglutarate ferredoxin oxidoreductase subunit beta
MSIPEQGKGGLRSLDLVPKASAPQSAKDFKTDQEVRWCPGCGDYAILAAVQGFMPELGLARENIVFVSGIGCSSRFPYYMDTFGMHSIHGRALKILLFNNRIYGLTKGQYSPTSELGKITKSTPLGSLDSPFNPVSLALGAEASFVARSIDSDRKHLTSVLRAAAAHRGTALVEIYQNCNIFNDDAFEPLKDPETRDDFTIRLEHGQPIRWGKDGEHGVVRSVDSSLKVVEVADVDEADLVVHDAHAAEPSHAFDLSRLSEVSLARTPIGVFRDVERPVYDDLMREQLERAAETQGAGDPDALAGLLAGQDTWTVD